MSWARSQLFWKIIGLYTLLSLLALTGLALTLNSRISVESDQLLSSAATAQLNQFCDDFRLALPNADDLDRWQQTLNVLNMCLLMTDQSGELLPGNGGILTFPEVVGDQAGATEISSIPAVGNHRLSTAVIRSTVQSAIRHGVSVRWLKFGPEEMRVLIIARPLQMRSSVSPVVLIAANAESEVRQQRNIAAHVVKGAVFTWFAGIVCVALIASGLVGPLQAMTANMGSEVGRDQRQDMLLRISDRNDELGHVAHSLTVLEEDRRDQLKTVMDAERQIRGTADLQKAVLDSMIEGVIAIDCEERILFLNVAARGLLGISNSVSPGRKIYEVVRLPAVLETIGDALKLQKTQTLEFRLPRENRFLAIVVSPILRGPQSGAVAVIRDISDLRRLESMRRDFVSGVSHELKTPLTVIQACTDTLLDGALSEPEEARKFLTQISEQSERLLELILGMLQLARVESGAEVFHNEPIELSELVDRTVELFRPVADARSVRLTNEGQPLMTVTADAQAVRTILSNLVDNAIRHTSPNGTVTITLRQDSSGCHVIVRDTGAGIAAEHLPRIFERFYRVERDRSRERGGTGLGLAIVKHLCLTMDATVSVTSEPGVGSEFRVTFLEKDDH